MYLDEQKISIPELRRIASALRMPPSPSLRSPNRQQIADAIATFIAERPDSGRDRVR